MSGLHHLGDILAGMIPKLQPEVFVFATFESREAAQTLPYQMLFEEAEGITLILRQNDADRAGLSYEFPCRMITLDVHSALAAVGFMALITERLASKGISVNPVSGFYHDHLFIPEAQAEEAVDLLMDMVRSGIDHPEK